MELTSNAIRSCLVAPPGKKLVVSDLANIEGRFAAWLASETWKLQAFRDYDAGIGPDLYILAYAKAFNILAEEIVKGDPRRQVGKVMELMLQYEGGVGAFLTGAATYGIDLDQLAEVAWASIPADVLAEAESAWQWAVDQSRTYDLAKKTYIVCDSLKRMWRRAHPAISSYWPELKYAAIAAITNKGTTVQCRKLKFRRDGQWLRMILPSGRALCYASPKFERGKITYAGVNPYTRQWGRTGTYGGKLFENACQGGALDVMSENMPEIERQDYLIVLTVHDEVITETEDQQDFSARHLSELLAANPPWARDMPLAAGGFEAHRYRKE
jgi:DNA polymerase